MGADCKPGGCQSQRRIVRRPDRLTAATSHDICQTARLTMATGSLPARRRPWMPRWMISVLALHRRVVDLGSILYPEFIVGSCRWACVVFQELP